MKRDHKKRLLPSLGGERRKTEKAKNPQKQQSNLEYCLDSDYFSAKTNRNK